MPILPPVYANPTDALAQGPVTALLLRFAAALPWLSHPFGLVQTGVLKDGKGRYPQLYLNNGKLESIGLWPDERMHALSFFEYEGPADYTYTDGTNRAGTITHNLAAVVWLNLKLIDPARGYDYSSLLAQDFIGNGLNKALPLGRLTVDSVEARAERIFQRYDFPHERHQLLMHPFAGFRVPFTVTTDYRAGLDCPASFVPAGQQQGQPVAPLISGLSDEALLAILLARGLGRLGHETNADYSPAYK